MLFCFTDPLSAHLFNIGKIKRICNREENLTKIVFTDSPKWKPLRMKLTPTFTSGKMKMMFETVCDVGKKFVKTLDLESTAAVGNEIEIKDIAARFTTDVIGSCAFGLECNSLEDPKNDFRQKSKRMFDDPKYSRWFIELIMNFKNLARKFHITLSRVDLTDFFMQIVKDTVAHREKNNVLRNDFLHMLIQLKNTGALQGETTSLGKLTIEEVAAQAMIFFLAG